jgi:IBR domain, a half RING-finger domain
MCLEANFRVSIRSMPFRPVQCCQRIDTILLRNSIISTDLKVYREKVSEFDAREKLYCWDPKCSAFIPPALRSGNAGSAKCRNCCTKTCMRCKGKFHFGPCPVRNTAGPGLRRSRFDEEAKFKRLSLLMGWKQCPDCKRMVEKMNGCNHIE